MHEGAVRIRLLTCTVVPKLKLSILDEKCIMFLDGCAISGNDT